MSEVRINHQVDIDITPDLLRQIADELDRRWDKVILGHEVPSWTFMSGSVTVRLVIDQERMRPPASAYSKK